MFLVILQVVFLVSLSVYLLVSSEPARDVARVVAGISAAVWALVLIIPGL
jgi:hypothetical protein